MAVQRQADHAEQAVDGRANLVTHVGQEGRACAGHVQRGLARGFQLAVGFAQLGVGELDLGGAGFDDAFQLFQILAQALLCAQFLPQVNVDALQLAVDYFDKGADFIALVAVRAGQPAPFALGAHVQQVIDQSHQRFGQHGVEQHHEHQRQDQAEDKAREHGQPGAAQEAGALVEGVDLNHQVPQQLVRGVFDIQRLGVITASTEQRITDCTIATGCHWPADTGQRDAVVVDDFCSNNLRRFQQAADQLHRQFRIDVVGNARSRAQADVDLRLNLLIDQGVFRAVVDNDLRQPEQNAQGKGD